MCTVTYLPLKDDNFLLTSNRDEAKSRSTAEQPKVHDENGVKIIFPKDGHAGGSWIGISEYDRAVCLLNGAFFRHQREESYLKSRGVVVKDALASESAIRFLDQYDLSGIEPFTLIIIDWRTRFRIWELRWDGFQKHIKALSNKPMIWSSAMLYTKEMKEKREKWFSEWLHENSVYTIESIRNFHKGGGEGDPDSDMLIDRGFLSTSSITSIEKTLFATNMIYEDLVTGTGSATSFDLQIAAFSTENQRA